MTVGTDAATIDVDFGALSGIDSGHEDVAAKLVAGEERRRFGKDVGAQFVDADVFHVNVGGQRVNDLVFGFAHIALQFAQHRDGSDGGHGFEHVLLPILSDVVGGGGDIGAEVGSDDGFLSRIGNVAQDEVAIGIDLLEQLSAVLRNGIEQDGGRGVKVFLVLDVARIALFAVRFSGNRPFVSFSHGTKAVGSSLHGQCTVVPRAHFGRVGFELCCKILVDGLILLLCVGDGAVEAVAHQDKALENVLRDVERQHRHQYHVHEVDHLLARRHRFFLGCHTL